MLKIEFEYCDGYSRGEWRKQTCQVISVQECIEIYGLNECEYRILSIEEV